MNINFSKLSTQFWSTGYCIIDNLFPDILLKEWKSNVEWLSQYSEAPGINKINKKFDKIDLETRDDIGEYVLTSIDGRICFDFKSLEEYYNSTANFLSLFTGLDIVTSFDKQSAVTFMLYPPPAGQMLSHYDTQDLSLLLYLTDNEDGETEIVPITNHRPTHINEKDEIIGQSIKILPKQGRCLIFQGKKVWHKACKVSDTPKISSAWNYYIRGNNFRPKEISERLYK